MHGLDLLCAHSLAELNAEVNHLASCLVLLLDNANESGMVTEHLVLDRVVNLACHCEGRPANFFASCELEEAEALLDLVKMGGLVLHLDRLAGDWVLLACELESKRVEVSTTDDLAPSQKLVAENFANIFRVVCKLQLATLKARLRRTGKCSYNQSIQVFNIVANKTAASTTILCHRLDHVNVTAVTDAEGVHSDIVFLGVCFFDDDISVFDLPIGEHKDPSLFLIRGQLVNRVRERRKDVRAAHIRLHLFDVPECLLLG